MPETIKVSISTLTSITQLLETLHANDIRYCHWKSNEHLSASMTGDTDLDILFDEKQKGRVEDILIKIGFKKFNAIRQKQYHDIVDFLGLDFQSGKIVHVHTHYKLTMGEPYLKGYHSDLEEKVLESRILDEEFGIYCTHPAFELILLYIRESLKIRHRDIFRMYFRNKINYSENVMREYHWLKARSSDEEVLPILKTIFTDYTTIYEFITADFNRKQVHHLTPLIKKEFAEKRLYTPLTALLLRWYREATVIISRKLTRLLGKPILSKRINPRGGIVVAIIGADGSGKSTVKTKLFETFQAKLDVHKIYFGRGDGKISRSRELLHSFKKIKRTDKKEKNNQPSEHQKKNGFFQTLYKCMEALLVAREKSKNLSQMQSAKKKGMLVICDRFPQNQIMGYNDGPLLHQLLNSGNPLFRLLAKVESDTYERAQNNPPDILFKLIADAEVVEKRKPGETSIERLKLKIAGIKELHIEAPCKVITVDASAPLEEVLYVIKKEIWNVM